MNAPWGGGGGLDWVSKAGVIARRGQTLRQAYHTIPGMCRGKKILKRT
jgi:hypothetical protein